jgi:hypothetical protein
MRSRYPCLDGQHRERRIKLPPKFALAAGIGREGHDEVG